jgi:iron complex transport system substrate-binding protein
VTVDTPNGAVTIDSQPTAIVSLSPTATEMLYAIGAGDQVVAVDKNSDYPHHLPKTRFDAYHLNIPSLTSADPDLVVAASIDHDQAAQYHKLHMTAVAEPAATRLDDTYHQITQLGRITGHPAKAAAVVRKMKSEIAEIVAGAPSFAAPPTYYYELDQTYYSVTSDTFVGHVLGLLGLKSIADQAKGAAKAGG